MEKKLKMYFISLANIVLNPKGLVYNKENEDFIRYDQSGYLRVNLYLRRLGLKYDIGYSIFRRYELIEKHWIDNLVHLGLSNQKKETFCTLCFGIDTMYVNNYDPLRSYNNVIYIEPTYQGIDLYFENFKNEMENEIFPFLDRFNNINEMDQYLNKPFDAIKEKMNIFYHYGIEYRKMIIAKYAGNPEYDKICKAMFDFINQSIAINESKYKGYLIAYNNVIESLKDIEPLKNPVLS
jgi:hypothetical protein